VLVLPRWQHDVGYDPETYWKGPLEVEWSLTFPVGQEPRPEVVKRIRSFFPTYVPLWVTRVHLHPDGVNKYPFTYHVIGRWRESPDPECPDEDRIIRALRPPDFPWRGGVIYQQQTLSSPWPDDSPQKYKNAPDFPLEGPTSMGLADWMEAIYKEARGSMEKLSSRISRKQRDKEDAEVKELEKLDEDKSYELSQYRNLWNQAISEGRIFDTPREYEPQPYAF
jgi:hypothetical protein